MGSPESGALDSLPGRRGPVGSTKLSGRRGVRVAGALGLFVAALLLLTGLGLALTDRRVEDWVLVARVESPDDAAEDVGYERIPFGLLAEWEDAREKGPPSVARLDRRRVEMYGFARLVEGGFWLASDPIAAGEDRKPVITESVWVEFPPGTSPSRRMRRGTLLRVRGVLRVGLIEVSGVGLTACRIELDELWLRESEGDAEEARAREDDDLLGHDH